MNGQTPVVIADLKIPFFRLMIFFIKAGLAAIPAAIIVALIVMVIAAAIAAALGGEPTFIIRHWM
jgi:VIT1/CCC1 family predicted Fe2+/Mn2+ transporter